MLGNDSLHLYNLTVRCPTAYTQALVGNYDTGAALQEIVLVSGTYLQMFAMDPETGKLRPKVTQDLLAAVNQVENVRLDNGKDALVVTSDSGNLSVLAYEGERLQKFCSVEQQPMAKNGWNKTYPGEYLAVDPQNRCILVGALEKSKLVYRIEKSADIDKKKAAFEISSPVELQTGNSLCLTIVALHTELENPLFCAIEFDPVRSQNACFLSYYEFDQGLNYLGKKRSRHPRELPSDANYLIPVPGKIGGVVVCGENWIMYERQDFNVVLPLPRRMNQNQNQNTVITGHASHVFKKKGLFIFLQSTHGDLFKMVFDYDADREVLNDIVITYFDTIPPCRSICVLKRGFLFANTLNSNQILYQFEKLGEDSTISPMTISFTEGKINKFRDLSAVSQVSAAPLTFELRGLENLVVMDTLQSLSPITDSKYITSNSQLKTLATDANLKTIIPGMPTTVLVESPLTITPTNVFTTKLTSTSANDEYLVFTSSLSSNTVVFAIGETLEDVADSGFVLDQPTVGVQQVGKSSVVQIYANGIRQISSRNKKTTDWYPPAGISIIQATANNSQVLVSLSNSEIVYFETDPSDDQLIEYQDKLETTSSVTSMAIMSLSQSQSHSNFAVIGCSDETIQVVSLQQQSCLEVKLLQALSSKANSLVMTSHDNAAFVHIGMENGVYARIKIDQYSGRLSDSRVKYLGSKPVNLRIVKLTEKLEGILLISSKPWIAYFHQGAFKTVPLIGIDIDAGASLVSEDIGGEGIVGFKKNKLVIFSPGEEDCEFDPTQNLTFESVKLRYMPRKLLEFGSRYYVSEVGVGITTPYLPNLTKEVADKVDEGYYKNFGYVKSPSSRASCVQVVHGDEIRQTLEFNKNEQIVGMTLAQFNKNNYLIVAVTNNTPSTSKNLLYTFKLDSKKKSNSLQYTHKTELNYQPQVVEFFNDKVLIAAKNTILLYEMGQRQLLCKSFTRIDFLLNITRVLICAGNRQRIVIADSQSSASITMARFDVESNQFVPIADEVIRRNCTSLAQLDYDTIIGGDKFGQIFISRLDRANSLHVDHEWSLFKRDAMSTSNSSLAATSGSTAMSSCVFKLRNVCEYYLPDIITSFQITESNGINDDGSVLYTGVKGTLGLFIPLVTKSEIAMLFDLELEMGKLCNHDLQQEQDASDESREVARWLSPLGKDHIKSKSYYNAAKGVIDGDFCELYLQLSPRLKLGIAQRMKRSVNEIEKKLNDLRNRSPL
ncbi:uncharacterized protein LODBEIA_P22300 [Lodderomyces beijingensis]|uniref:Pre-mRNA-splicing factor RSE1 n=1 Tax=Lodderomyces beijingensis TaxID=1775926 RepID=A0ABP0ZIN7_9ASCO